MPGNDIVSVDRNTLVYACGHLDLPYPTSQEQQYILNRSRGLTVATSARAAGLKIPDAEVFEQGQLCIELLRFIREHQAQTVAITKDKVTMMFLDAYDNAATSAERISAAKELGMLHDLYPSKAAVQINNSITNNNVEENDKKLQRMSTEDLLRITGEVITLDPEPDLEPDATSDV